MCSPTPFGLCIIINGILVRSTLSAWQIMLIRNTFNRLQYSLFWRKVFKGSVHFEWAWFTIHFSENTVIKRSHWNFFRTWQHIIVFFWHRKHWKCVFILYVQLRMSIKLESIEMNQCCECKWLERRKKHYSLFRAVKLGTNSAYWSDRVWKHVHTWKETAPQSYWSPIDSAEPLSNQ